MRGRRGKEVGRVRDGRRGRAGVLCPFLSQKWRKRREDGAD